jgi:hypothetical protein
MHILQTAKTDNGSPQQVTIHIEVTYIQGDSYFDELLPATGRMINQSSGSLFGL